jgi:hypothetical protein
MATVSELRIYLVYFHVQSLDVLGDAIKPYLTEAPEGKHLRCKEIDSGGGFFQCALAGADAAGKPLAVDLLVPGSMIRLVVSASGSEIEFGFT